jgi:pseudouridine kinase
MKNSIHMNANSPILVLGASGLDVIGRLESELQTGTSNPACIRTGFGGVARNVAENLARLGQAVQLITAVGKDKIGDELLAYTEAAGVDVSASLRASEYPTGFYMGVLDQNSTRLFGVDDMRVINCLTPETLRARAGLFNTASLLFIDANLPEKTLKSTFSLAKKARIPICADATSSALANKLQPYFTQIFLLTCNSAEASILTGLSFESSERRRALEAARSLVARGVDIALVTLAEFGVVYATSETTGHIPAIKTKTLDPTGAGDALTAAVLFALQHDMPLDDAVRLGVSAASLTLRHPGTVYPQLSLEILYDELT